MSKIEKLENYINGQFVSAQNGDILEVFEPATARVYATIPNSAMADVENAVEAAKKALVSWAKLSNQERSYHLTRLADAIEENLEEFAIAESKDNGKPLKLSRTVDIPRAVSNFRFFAHAATQFGSEAHHMHGVGINYTLRLPIGVVGCISPWNLPLYLFTWKIAPALAVGNTVVAKPSEVTPYTAYLLSKICERINFPEGVLNIVHGLGNSVGEAICVHSDIKAISFTGGTSTGKRIAQVIAPLFKKMSLELGGKNPTLIFGDCDYDDMLSTVVRSSFANQGQICLCGSRILVEASIYEKFKRDFILKVSKLSVGDPFEPGSHLGAVVSLPHMNKVLSYIQLAQEEGGKILIGGKRKMVEGRCELGWFLEPTVIEDLSMDCRTNQEEIFGPVVTIAPFKTEDEALSLANNSPYGLATSVWTKDINRAHRLAEELHFGIVWINCWLVRDLRTPFGGMKSSGVGREGGFEAMRFFTEPKNVCVKYF